MERKSLKSQISAVKQRILRADTRLLTAHIDQVLASDDPALALKAALAARAQH